MNFKEITEFQCLSSFIESMVIYGQCMKCLDMYLICEVCKHIDKIIPTS